MSDAITFFVPGREAAQAAGRSRGAIVPLPGGLRDGRLKHSVDISTRRDGDGAVAVTAVPGQDVVVLKIAGGPELVLHPESARDLMLAQSTTPRSRGADDDRVPVPERLQWRGLEQGGQSRGASRGTLGDVMLSAVHVVTDPFGAPAAFTAAEIVKRFDGHVEAGVYQLSGDALPMLKGGGLDHIPAAGDAAMLVLIHGTFSDTKATFGKLWTNYPQRVRSLFKNYGNRVYGLEHPTLGASPIANAIALARVLPDGARLHLLTHSRGGLVAEVLAHVCANAGSDLTPFAGPKYAAQREELKTLATLVGGKGITVERVVRVACPARGTLLASKRLDAYLSVFKWTLELAGIPAAPALVDFLGAVAQHRTDPEEIPGLAAQMPDSPLVQWLHAVTKPIDGRLRVVAGDLEGDSVVSWLKTLLADAFYWTDNDLVVQTRSMYGGGPRATGRELPARRGRQGLALQLLHERTDRRGDRRRAAAGLADRASVRSDRCRGPAPRPSGDRGAVESALQRSEKPAVFLLPGILGSNLAVDKKRVWVGWRLINGLERLRYPDAKNVTADGPIGSVYDDLLTFLSATHEVIPFAFDWRVPIEQEAKRLAGMVDEAVTARKNEQRARPHDRALDGRPGRAHACN